MGRFDSEQLVAEQLIDLNGEDATLETYSTNPPDPARPWLTGVNTTTQVPVRAVFLNYSSNEAGVTYADGTEIHQDDKKILIAARGLGSVVPNLQGCVTRQDGTKYRIIKVKTLDPAGQRILHEVQGRI
jgi:hypothetical protein